MPKAQYNLGFMYLKSEGVAQNYVMAYKWINLGARDPVQGDEDGARRKHIRDTLARIMTPEQLSKAENMGTIEGQIRKLI